MDINRALSPGSRARRGFTLIELLVVICDYCHPCGDAATGVGERKKQRRNRFSCINNLRQVGIALALYLNDNKAYPGVIR